MVCNHCLRRDAVTADDLCLICDEYEQDFKALRAEDEARQERHDELLYDALGK